MRENLVKSDLVEAVIGLGANLFFNSPMEACILVCRSEKPSSRAGKVLFIDASSEVTRKNAQSFLEDRHIAKIVDAYRKDENVEGFSFLADVEDIAKNSFSLSIPLYVRSSLRLIDEAAGEESLSSLIDAWRQSASESAILFENLENALFVSGGEQND